MRAPINTLQLFLQQVENIGEAGPSQDGAISERGATFLMKLFTGTRNFANGFFTTVLFLFFLLVSGDIFLHRLVEILPRFRSKRQVVEISQQIESDVSAYLVTITIMNAAVGIATALAMWLTGVGDPILLGTVAFLLNYVPILGTALGVLIFLLAGLLTHDTLWQALLPAGLYFGFHLIEGETLTPMLLAKRFTLNPVLVIISLVFWFWTWGIPGGILSMPMLSITKIICDRSCERHGGGASSTPIEAPSQSAQDPYHLGWTPLSVLTSPGAKRTRHVFDPFYRRHMLEVPQASKALRYRGTSGEPSPRNPQLPMHRLRSCISQSHLTEAG